MFDRILLATGGSDSASCAAWTAGEWADRFKAEVLMICTPLPIAE